MLKTKKHKKISSRVKMVDEETLFKLYNDLPIQCVNCCYNYNCPQIIRQSDTSDCENYKMAYNLNEIIDMINDERVNLRRLCEDYGLQFKYLMKFLKAEELFNYKYYSVLMDRLLEKDEFLEYEDRFEDNEYGFNDEIEYDTSKEGE